MFYFSLSLAFFRKGLEAARTNDGVDIVIGIVVDLGVISLPRHKNTFT